MSVQFSVFTKGWKTLTADQLGKFVSGLGFDGIELPLRPGFQVEPADAEKELPRFVARMGQYGLKVFSVAGTLDEHIFAACAAAGVPIIRTFVAMDADGFHPSIARAREMIGKALPLSEKYGVTIGIQNHIGCLANGSGLIYFLEEYNPRHVAAVWDAAHNALQGEEPEISLSAVWNNVAMVNLKNAVYLRVNGPEAEEAQWRPYWTNGRQGLASWRRVIDYVKKHEYRGVICLTAEYSDEANADRYIAEDIRFAKSLYHGERS